MPRTVWTLWLQGWSNAPPMVAACLRTWRAHNPTWTVRSLAAEDLPALLDGDPTWNVIQSRALSPPHQADLVRIGLLRRYGGVWADATCYCLKPLDAWLPEAAATGFFAFDRPAEDRMVANWFIASTLDHHITERWHADAVAYWRDRAEPHTYYWMHHLFGEAYREDALLRRLWDTTPKLPADGAFRYLPTNSKLPAPALSADWAFVDDAAVPVLKLSHSASGPDGSVFAYLCHRARDAVGTLGDRTNSGG
jgi:hypothetical protein